MYEDLKNIIIEAANDRGVLIDEKKLRSKIEKNIHPLNMHDEIKIDTIDDLINKINLDPSIETIISNNSLTELIKKQSTYYPDIDKIIIIGDRDRQSFVDKQYDRVLDLIKDRNIDLIISNPCLEFWFLLHYTDAKEINKKEWNSLPDAAQLVINELKKFETKYKKTNINIRNYIGKEDTAIKNAKLYSTNLVDLKNNIGTNMEKLFEILKEM